MNKNEEFEIIRERMKARPVNRKKLLRRMFITALMAVVFGVLACVTFLLLQPVISNIIAPEDEPKVVVIPLDPEETLPTDLAVTEDELEQVVIEEDLEEEPVDEQDDSIEPTAIENYQSLYADIYEMVGATKKSIVTVEGIKQDIDIFNNSYESKDVTTGIIVANNGKELLILADSYIAKNYENIKIGFYTGHKAYGTEKESDKNTGLSIIAVPIDNLNENILDEENIAKLGNSKLSRILASPVIAVGMPIGKTNSVEFGMVTSKGNSLKLTDCNYELLTTDIFGTSDSNGVLINLSGEVIGIICQKNNTLDKSILTAYGISDLKRTIERMSNGRKRAVLGVVGMDVPSEAIAIGVPAGAYVESIDMDSPAMEAGIQSGDVIVGLNNVEIMTFDDLTSVLNNMVPDSKATVKIRRISGDEYREMEVQLMLAR